MPFIKRQAQYSEWFLGFHFNYIKESMRLSWRGRKQSPDNKIATEGQTEGNCHRGFRSHGISGTAEGEITHISNTWTNHPNCIRFLKIFSGWPLLGQLYKWPQRRATRRMPFKDPRKTHFSKSFSAQLSLPPSISDSLFGSTGVRKTHRIPNHRGKLRGQPYSQ